MKDYGELVVTASKMSGDVDAANFASTLVSMAERKLSRRLRTRQQQRIKTFTTDVYGTVPLPRGFIDLIHIYAGKKRLEAIPNDALKIQSQQGYNILGNRIYTSEPQAELELAYYEEIPALEHEGCNWLLEVAPDIYLQALMLEISAKNLDVEKASIIQSYLDRLILDFTQHNKSTMITTPTAGGIRP